MRRILALVLPWVPAIGAEAAAQDWAKKMFEATVTISASWRGDPNKIFVRAHQHLQGRCPHLRCASSCGCTTPRVTKDRSRRTSSPNRGRLQQRRSWAKAPR